MASIDMDAIDSEGSRQLVAGNGPLQDREDKCRLFRFVRLAIAAKNFVEPLGWFTIHVGVLPGVPRQVRLRFAGNEPPVYRRDVIFLCDRQRALKRAAISSSHILRAKNGPSILLERQHVLLKNVGAVVTVKGNDVGECYLNSSRRPEVLKR
jgi:hypothetical protein